LAIADAAALGALVAFFAVLRAIIGHAERRDPETVAYCRLRVAERRVSRHVSRIPGGQTIALAGALLGVGALVTGIRTARRVVRTPIGRAAVRRYAERRYVHPAPPRRLQLAQAGGVRLPHVGRREARPAPRRSARRAAGIRSGTDPGGGDEPEPPGNRWAATTGAAR
jgi:hypothetical protein